LIGDTLEEARAMAENAIRGYLESLRKHGEAILIEQGEPITERILVSLPDA
jgi:predicted RNase H-like HicB family nuclease